MNIKEIQENEFNLNIRRYVESEVSEAEVDVSIVRKELVDLEKQRIEVDKRLDEYLDKLAY